MEWRDSAASSDSSRWSDGTDDTNDTSDTNDTVALNLVCAYLQRRAEESTGWLVQVRDTTLDVDDPFALRFVGPFATEYEALMYAAYVDEIVLTQSAEIDGLEVTIKGLELPCADYRSA